MVNVTELKRFLKSQGTAPDAKQTNRQVIISIRSEIENLIERNWAWPAIANLLAQKGIIIKPNTLRNYYYTADAPSSSSPKGDAAPSRGRRAPRAAGKPKDAPPLPPPPAPAADAGDFAAFPRA